MSRCYKTTYLHQRGYKKMLFNTPPPPPPHTHTHTHTHYWFRSRVLIDKEQSPRAWSLTVDCIFNRVNQKDTCFASDCSWPCPRLSRSCPGSCSCWRKSWRKKRCVERHVRLPEPPRPPSRSRWWGKYLREYLFMWASVFVGDILEHLVFIHS